MTDEPSSRSNRVTGILVLGLLAVVAIPAFIDFRQEQDETPSIASVGLDMPGKYQSRIVPLDESELIAPDGGLAPLPTEDGALASSPESRAEKVDLAETQPQMLELHPDRAAENEHQAPALRERVGLTAWVVQLGSFQDRERATKLLDELRKQSLPAFLEQTGLGETSRVRVRVGPELERDKARIVRDRIAAEMAIEGLVLRYPSK